MDMDPINHDADFELPDLGGLDLPDMDDLGGFGDPVDPVDPADDPLADPADPADPLADPGAPADPVEPVDGGVDPVVDPDPIEEPADDPAGEPADDPADDPGIELPVDDGGDPGDVDPVDEIDPNLPADPDPDPDPDLEPEPMTEPVVDPTWAEFLSSHQLDPAEFDGDSLEEIVAQLEAHGIEVEPVAGHEHLLELVDQGHRILVVVVDVDDEVGPPTDPTLPGDPTLPADAPDPADSGAPSGPDGELVDLDLDPGLPGRGRPDFDLGGRGNGPTGPGFSGGPGGLGGLGDLGDLDPSSDLPTDLPIDLPIDGAGPSIFEGTPSADGTSLEIDTPDGPTSIPLPDIDPGSILKASAGTASGMIDGNIVLGAAGVILIAGGAVGLHRSRR